MIHHSHPHCDDCGEQHTPGAPAECIAGLKIRAEQAETDRDAALARAEAAEKRIREGVTMWTILRRDGGIAIERGHGFVWFSEQDAENWLYMGSCVGRVLILDDAEPEATP